MLKIAIFVSFSGHGGVERMMLNLAEGEQVADCRAVRAVGARGGGASGSRNRAMRPSLA